MPTLPIKDELGFFEMRFESIGGLGAHLAGQMLAEAAVLRQGLNGAHFSSYGSEKKGSPVKSFVRVCEPDVEVRSTSPVQQPHLVAVFHEGLLKTESVTSGLRPGGIFLVNTEKAPTAIRKRLQLSGVAVGTVDAMGIAVEEKTRVNTAMLGAVSRTCPWLDPDVVKETIRATFQKKYPHLVEANLRTFDRGFKELQLDLAPAGSDASREFVRPGPLYGYMTAPLGGAIVNPGNSVLKDLSASRQGFLPAFYREKCVDCAMCELACPDFCFVWTRNPDPNAKKGRMLQGIDYQFCKGCLKCVEACPVDALQTLRESEGYAEEHRVAKFAEALERAASQPGQASPNGRKIAKAAPVPKRAVAVANRKG